jgi:hypothetical protein
MDALQMFFLVHLHVDDQLDLLQHHGHLDVSLFNEYDQLF